MINKIKIVRRAMPIIILWLFLLAVSGTFADTTSPPCSYRTFSSDGKYFFVMLASKDKKDVECIGQTKEKQSDAGKIRKAFSTSGLYEGVSLLWKVDWYSDTVYVADDGKHVVRVGPWASRSSDEAFSLIEEGELKKTYRIEDLIISIDSLPHSVSHFEWLKESKLDSETNTFSVTTLENRKFICDLNTGAIRKVDENNKSDTNRKENRSVCGGIALFIGLVLLGGAPDTSVH